MDDGDETWTPPTEAEQKFIQATRERNDKISGLMGKYLLMGYKMLSTTCENCNTILLQSKQQDLYCVACYEVDNEHAKDNPVLDGTAARRLIEESDHRSPSFEGGVERQQASSSAAVNHNSHPPPSKQPNGLDQSNANGVTEENGDWLSVAQETLKSTLKATLQHMAETQEIDDRIRQCVLVKASAEALLALQSLKKST